MTWDDVKKHGDTIVVLITLVGSILTSVLWMSGKFNGIERELTIIKNCISS